MFTNAKNKWGTTYPYFICVGRARKTTTCDWQATLAATLEQLIEDEYRSIALAPELRDAIDELVQIDFESLQEASAAERQQLDQQRIALTAKRQKLLDAHYAGAIPLDLLKTEQHRLASQLNSIQQQLSTAEANFQEARQMLADTLDLARDCHAAYLEADDPTRRLFNQAFFTKIYIDERRDSRSLGVRVDYQMPFDDLLNRLIPAGTHSALQNDKTAHRTSPMGGSSLPTPGVPKVESSHTSTLVELRGFEPLAFSLRTRRATNCATAPEREER